MFQGLDHVYQAVRVLAVRNARINQRLFEAADQFSRAMDRPDQWPGDLLGRAAAIHQKLTARGKIDTTIAGMDVSVAERLAGEMLDLAMDIRAAQNQQAELSGPINASRRHSRRTQSRRTLMSRSY
jgi:hypothetical protein